MENKITAFIDELIIYDYILFGAVIGVFFLLIIFAILLRKKSTLAMFTTLLALLVLLLGPTLGYIQMHQYLYKNSIKLVSQKKLEFVEAIVVKGTLSNESERDFESCKITANVHKVSKNSFKNYIYQFKTLKKMSILKENIPKGSTTNFKILVEPFRYSRDYNISLGANCK
jgi:hypothetical protein